jgi:hypothetical protein
LTGVSLLLYFGGAATVGSLNHLRIVLRDKLVRFAISCSDNTCVQKTTFDPYQMSAPRLCGCSGLIVAVTCVEAG